jgi:hypothetical protein
MEVVADESRYAQHLGLPSSWNGGYSYLQDEPVSGHWDAPRTNVDNATGIGAVRVSFSAEHELLGPSQRAGCRLFVYVLMSP